MELVMRVSVAAEDDDIARWAKTDEVEIGEVEKDLKEDAKRAIRKIYRETGAYIEFIEWEE